MRQCTKFTSHSLEILKHIQVNRYAAEEHIEMRN